MPSSFKSERLSVHCIKAVRREALGEGCPLFWEGVGWARDSPVRTTGAPTPPPDFLTIFLCCMELGRSGCRKFVSALSLSPKIVQAKELRAVCASFLVQSQ